VAVMILQILWKRLYKVNQQLRNLVNRRKVSAKTQVSGHTD
jgi:hypothetical protein